jgi:hypothetical protein
VTLLNLDLLNSSSPFRTFLQQETNILALEILKISNAGYPLILQINTLFLLMNMKDPIHIIAFLLKVLLKEFGKKVRMLMLEENQFQEIKNGKSFSKKQMKNLVETEKEF